MSNINDSLKNFKINVNPVTITFYGLIIFIILSVLIVITTIWKMLTSGTTQTVISSILETIFDSEYLRTIFRTIKFAFLAIIIKFILSFPLALIVRDIHHKVKSSLILLPWILPPAISALAWMWFFYDIDGGFNIILRNLGFNEVSWLGSSDLTFFVCLFFNIWREVPLWTWIISPALTDSKDSLEMLSRQDKLTKWEKFYLLNFPKLRPTFFVLFILSLIWTFGEFESIWLLTKGGPGESTELISIYAYRHTFLAQNIARGATAFLCFLPISITLITILVILFQWSSKRST